MDASSLKHCAATSKPPCTLPKGLPNLQGVRPHVARASAIEPQPAAQQPVSARRKAASHRGRVLDLVAACVECNALVQRFETLAGRSAMVGFLIAVAAECLGEKQGLFGAWSPQDIQLYSAAVLLLVSSSAILATMSKRIGRKFQEAVLTSLTALSGSKGSLTYQNVDKAVDYVFDSVFDKELVFGTLVDDIEDI